MGRKGMRIKPLKKESPRDPRPDRRGNGPGQVRVFDKNEKDYDPNPAPPRPYNGEA